MAFTVCLPQYTHSTHRTLAMARRHFVIHKQMQLFHKTQSPHKTRDRTNARPTLQWYFCNKHVYGVINFTLPHFCTYKVLIIMNAISVFPFRKGNYHFHMGLNCSGIVELCFCYDFFVVYVFSNNIIIIKNITHSKCSLMNLSLVLIFFRAGVGCPAQGLCSLRNHLVGPCKALGVS